MALRHWLLSAAVVVLVGCQAAVPTVPTPTPAVPTPLGVPTPTRAAPTPPAAPTASPVSAPSPVSPPPVGSTRVETLNAANTAYRSGDLKTAAGLYDRVINSPPSQTEAAAGSAAITDFARFRGMLSRLADGREDEARVDLQELQKRDPGSPLARLASQVYDQYGMTGQLRGACAQLQPQVTSQAGPTLATLQGLGVAVDAPTLCSVP